MRDIEEPASRSRSLTVAVVARLPGDGSFGGVEQFALSLVYTLGILPDGDERYIIVTHPAAPHWLDSYLGRNQTVVTGNWSIRDTVRRSLGPLRPFADRLYLYAVTHGRPLATRALGELPGSNGFFERLGADVVHFTSQQMVATTVPSIFNPHDLQHRHFPEFFSEGERVRRDSHYIAACRSATVVAVASDWIRRDVSEQLEILEKKIQIIPDASPMVCQSGSNEGDSSSCTLPIATQFALYPAQTWPHKNHIRLLEAVAINRDRYGIMTNVVCTGAKNDFWPNIEAKIAELHLEGHVVFPGYVSQVTLQRLYREAMYLIMPTLHESVSYPIFEAFAAGLPVACSAVTSLPEQCGPAGYLFDPLSTESIAAALRAITLSADLRHNLAKAGKERATIFNLERTAMAYRALYRKLGGVKLDPRDRALLSTDWMAATGKGSLS